MGKKKTAIEVYLSAVFKWGLLILVCACMCATMMFNTEKLLGLYPDVPWIALLLFAVMDITFFVIALLIIKTSFGEDGYLKDGKLKNVSTKQHPVYMPDNLYNKGMAEK